LEISSLVPYVAMGVEAQVDWDGKVALIQCAQAMGIQRFVFFIHNCEKHPEVPLMEVERCTEKYIAECRSGFHAVWPLSEFVCGFEFCL
jgi:hypothetical protein